ncbi:MAG: phosphotransferase family protein [bacterium]
MLSTTLNTDFTPGTNRKGDMVSADWRFLLPNLEMDTIVCVGMPPISTTVVLSKMCRELFIFANHQLKIDLYYNALNNRNVKNLRMLLIKDSYKPVLSEKSVDLVFATTRKHFSKIIKGKQDLMQLSQILKPTGVVFLKVDGLLGRRLIRLLKSNLVEDGAGYTQEYWLAPALGRMRLAVPLNDRETGKFFTEKMLNGRSLKNKLLRSYGKLLGSYPRAIIRGMTAPEILDAPPDYLLTIGQKAGLDLSAYSWCVSAGGRYNAKKIVFYLFSREADKPVMVIKLTRSPEFNYRLENEYTALNKLRDQNIVECDSYPEPLFLDYHGNLAVVGQKVISGESLSECTVASAGCPFARATIAWLTDFAQKTVQRIDEDELPKMVNSLRELLSRFARIYKMHESHLSFLSEQIDRLALADSSFPLVFQHGDAGCWNVIITDNRKIAYVDWEAAEPLGMPLWDLFYFVKTFGTIMFRKSGVHNSLLAFEQNILMPSELGTLLIEVCEHYCETLQINKNLLEPLFYTCWVHRALKEATRLSAQTLDSGHYVNLLRVAIEHKNTPVLQRLFSLSQNDGV